MRRLWRKSLVAVMAMIFAGVPVFGAGEGRVAGTVVDSDGNPLQDVQITVNAVGYAFETTRTTNKKGRFTLLLMDATKDYTIRFEKDGFVSIEEPLDPPLGQTLRQTWTMTPGQGGGPPRGADAPGVGPAVDVGTGAAGRKYSQGMEAFQQEDYATARTRFEEVVELQPDLPEAYTALAMTMLRQGSYEEALAQTERVLELRPDDVLALKVQYEVYREMGNSELEQELLDRLIEISSDKNLAPLAFNDAVARVQAGDLEAGAARFEQVLALDPDLLPVYSALARVYFDLGRMDDSIAMSERYLEQDPGNGDVLGVLYLAYDRQGKSEEAEAVFERLKGADSSQITRVMEEMGVTYFNGGNTEQAKVIFERILELNADHPGAHYHLALCYAGLGDTVKAKDLLTRFIELAPEDPNVAVAQEMIDSM